MIVKTERLKLIACNYDMILEIINSDIGSDKLFNYNISQLELKKIKKIAPVFKGLLKEKKDKYYWYMWIIVNIELNTIIGDAGFKGKPNNEGLIDIGYSIDEKYRKNGFATECANGLVKWAFTKKKVKGITAACKENNTNSINVLLKLNMKKILHENGFMYWKLKNS
ncbi:GNAT family N-acetyltransferase [Helicovermis profundi]|uniref:GNAT family N-acetyltransferase n=1 Tax=Helicovermis profundi TaxID=3065157 RepID=A0AAU9E1Q9_9FIRM|nr:GNAT family N-acetyltransferase [Clostridia bacterium S502]